MIVVTLALVAVAYAVPVNEVNGLESTTIPVEPIKIIRSDYDQQPNGEYVFSFETENGINRDENGELKEALDEKNKTHTVIVVRGSYSYTDDDGKVETINYSADEKGYHAEGESIPTNAPSSR
ncbi:unnamed protein product [Parnassius mnemosyne]|uniref:Larval cuticle protein 1 n=1 Tax=Parnassius mnemosyne TaxID=213953 RepID=A0AAV1MAC3_9NEOP